MTGGGSGREGGRALKTRVKTARKRSLASTLWLERQLNDPYVAQARREGYRSRAAYKLIEIDDKHKLFKPGQRIVDLGAAPGGWSQVAAARVQAREGRGRVIAIDLLEMDPIEGVEFRRMDFHDPERAGALARMARRPRRRRPLRHGGQRHRPPQDRSSAHRRPRRARRRLRRARFWRRAASSSPRCCRAAPRASCSPGSSASSPTVRHLKPKASRADSAELYVLATGFRGRRRVETQWIRPVSVRSGHTALAP